MKKGFPFVGIAVIIAVIVATVFIMGLLPTPPVWLVVIVVTIYGAFVLKSFISYHHKRVAHENELEWFEELAKEHEEGKRDNRDYLERLIRSIEKDHQPSPALAKRLDRVRRILE